MNIVKQIINRYPVRKLYNTYSPIQRLERLEKKINSPNRIYIKRDDLLRPMFGNKIRYIEYLFGQYDKTNSDCIVHAGGATSNYMAQLAMAGASEDIPVYILINCSKPELLQGNLLINTLFSKNVHYFNTDKNTNSEIKKEFYNNLKSKGKSPFLIDYPLGNFYAHLGYMKAYYEIKEQINEGESPEIGHIFHCSGFQSYIGLKTAVSLLNDNVRITAFRASKWDMTGLSKIYSDINQFLKAKIEEFSEFLETEISVDSFEMTDDYVGKAYAVPTNESLDTVKLLASTEGILLDPIYTGKAFYGMLDYIRRGEVRKDDKLLFIHSGGIVNNFVINKELSIFLNSK